MAAEDHDAIVASGLRIEDFAEIDRTIAALDRQVRSNVPRKKALDMFADCGGSERLTGALLDRLTHHVRILTMNGDSYRLKQSTGRRRTAVETVAAEQSQATAETDDKPQSV